MAKVPVTTASSRSASPAPAASGKSQVSSTGANADLSSLLKKASAKYDEAVKNAKATAFPEWDDMVGPFRLIGFDIRESTGKNPAWGVLFQWECLEGEMDGDTYYKWMNLMDYENEDEISRFLIQDLEKITGTDASELDITQLSPILKDACKQQPVWQCRIKTNKEFKNFNLVKELDATDYEDEDEEETPRTAKAKTSTKSVPPAPPKGGSASSGGKKKPAKKECPFSVDDTVYFVPGEDEDEVEGTVTAIDEESETLTVKVGTGRKSKTYEDLSWDLVSAEPTPEEDEAEWEVGQKVTWSVEVGTGRKKTTEERTGTIHEVYGDDSYSKVRVGGTAKKPLLEDVDFSDLTLVEEEDEDEEEEDFSDLTLVEEEDEDEEEEDGDVEGTTYAEGDEVTFEVDGNELSGTITEVDNDEETMSVEVTTGKRKKTHEISFDQIVTEDAAEEEDEEEEGEELEVGMTVQFTDEVTKRPLVGKVTKIDEKTGIISVKVGALVKKVKDEDISIVKDPEG